MWVSASSGARRAGRLKSHADAGGSRGFGCIIQRLTQLCECVLKIRTEQRARRWRAACTLTINDYTELNTFYEKSEIDWDGDHSIDYCTNPNDADTDDDGCRDDFEINGWPIIIYDQLRGEKVTDKCRDVNSEPLVPDTDKDTLLDGDEYCLSDPTSDDTDSDHIYDWKEKSLGTQLIGIDGEPPTITYNIQKIKDNPLDGGLINVELNFELEARDYSKLDYLEIKLKTYPPGGGSTTKILASWSRGDSDPCESINIFGRHKIYPRDSYDVIFTARDLDGHETVKTHHIDSGWETFVNILNQVAQAVYNYIIGPIKDWVLSTYKSSHTPAVEDIDNAENSGECDDLFLGLKSIIALPATLLTVPFIAMGIISIENDLTPTYAELLNEYGWAIEAVILTAGIFDMVVAGIGFVGALVAQNYPLAATFFGTYMIAYVGVFITASVHRK